MEKTLLQNGKMGNEGWQCGIIFWSDFYTAEIKCFLLRNPLIY